MQAYISTAFRVVMLISGTRASFTPATGEELGTTLALARPVSLCTPADRDLVEAVQRQWGVSVPVVTPAPVISLWPGDVLYLLQADPADPQAPVQICRVTAQSSSEPLPIVPAAAPDQTPAVWVGTVATPC